MPRALNKIDNSPVSPFRHRIRAIALLVAASALLPVGADAQEWANAMFKGPTKHDFDVVARGAKAECRFKFENIYLEDVHVESVTSTCQCTVPRVTKSLVKTYDSAEIVCEVDTRTFMGHKEATIKVVFDKPFRAEVQLHTTVFIRSDVVFQPGAVQFGTVPKGTACQKKISVLYAGRPDWQIVGLNSTNPHLSASIQETERNAGNVSYDLTVSLRESAPPGYILDHLVLSTNDPDAKTARVPLTVEGVVTEAVAVSPSRLVFVASPGQATEKRVIVRSDQPFRITGVACADGRFSFQAEEKVATVHVVGVTFSGDATAGAVDTSIQIRTDNPEAPQISVPVSAQFGQSTSG